DTSDIVESDAGLLLDIDPRLRFADVHHTSQALLLDDPPEEEIIEAEEEQHRHDPGQQAGEEAVALGAGKLHAILLEIVSDLRIDPGGDEIAAPVHRRLELA